MASLLVFSAGLVFGSFISALTYRYPKGISVARGRSFCPKCNSQIGWRDNIPLLSYILLGGKCRSCKKRISMRYPLIELSSGIGFLLFYLYYPRNLVAIIFGLIVFCILMAIFVTDVEYQIIPDDFVFFGIVVVLLSLLITSHGLLFPSLLSGFVAASLLLLINLFTKGKGMGLGDVKFAVLGGMIVGLPLMLVWMFLSFLTGGLAGIILILGKFAGLKDKIAFGPFLILGLVIALLWGERILHLLL